MRAEMAHYRAHTRQAVDAAALAGLRLECAWVLADVLALGPGGPELLPALGDAISYRLYPDALYALDRLRDAGLRVAVLSNWDASLHDALGRLGVADRFAAVVVSAEIGAEKPAPEAFAAVARRSARRRTGSWTSATIRGGTSTAPSPPGSTRCWCSATPHRPGAGRGWRRSRSCRPCSTSTTGAPMADLSHGPSTRAIHAALGRGGNVVGPVERSVIARFDTAARFGRVMAGEEEGYLYGRIGSNPTVEAAAAAVAGLEGAERGLLTASGMAAIHAAVVAHLPAGGRLVASSALYGNTLSLFRDHIGPREGTHVELVDVRDLPAIERACADGVDVLYAETVANPGTTVANLPALAAIAERAGGRLIVDNTIATPLLCRPLEHGATVVVHSATKFLNGHHDVLAGVICGSAADLAPVRAVLIDTGGVCDPDSAWLLTRGLMTLSLRLERQLASTQALAEHLAALPGCAPCPIQGGRGTPITRSRCGCSGAVRERCCRSRSRAAGTSARP